MTTPDTTEVTEAQLIREFSGLRQHSQRGQRAPHKPLLLLTALANVQQSGPRLLVFNKTLIEKMTALLDEFGRPLAPGGQQTVRDPFWRLEGDGHFWEVPQRQAILAQRAAGRRDKDINKGELVTAEATGGFRADVNAFLSAHPEVVHRLATLLLDAHFPASLHESILDAVGMAWTYVPVATRRVRDPGFRTEILRIYESRCCACGYDGRLGRASVGIEAAHIRWHSADGPDHPTNGLALCALHHKAFDVGAFGVTEGGVISVSQHYVESMVLGGQGLASLHGRSLPMPISGPADRAAGVFTAWHRAEVFRGPGRF